ncbi:nitroreductase family protein [Candidatus Sumerlaeota bacterium]|nr:nitroreductase family protein [Candidatus Sumerlaeota bacterium]
MKGADAFLSFLRERRSVRRFCSKPVPQKLLAQLVEWATWAPSAGNRQDWFFTVITSATVRREMAEAVRRRWDAIIAANRGSGVIEEVERYVEHFGDFALAPAVIVVSARAPDSVQRHLLGDAAEATTGSAASAAMAAQNLMLAAHALGLGSCCMTGALAARDELKRILGLSKRQEIVCLIAVGWPDEKPVPPPRKPVSEIGRFVE